MSAFKKGWVQQFKSDHTKEDAFVHASYSEQPLKQSVRRSGRPAAVPHLPIAEEIVREWPLFMTVKEVASVLRFKEPESVTALIRCKLLLAKKVRSKWRIPRASLVQYLSEMESIHVA